MRTTLDIADHILIEAKRLAARRRSSLAGLVEDSLRKYLADEAATHDRPKGPRLRLMDGGEPLPGIDLTDTSRLFEE